MLFNSAKSGTEIGNIDELDEEEKQSKVCFGLMVNGSKLFSKYMEPPDEEIDDIMEDSRIET